MLLVLLMISAAVGYDRSVNYWEAFAPGKLLQRLDALTSDDVQPGRTTTQLAMAQAKLDQDADDVEETDVDADLDSDADADADAIEHDDDDVEPELEEADSRSAEGHSGEDYERNYEQFVRAYFERAADADADADVDVDDDADDDAAAQLDGSVELLQQDQKPKPKPKRCRRVRRNGQLCKICREPRNHEISETCSYSHEAQPELYAYGSGSQYKRYREPQPDGTTAKRHTTVVQQPEQGQSQSQSQRLDGDSSRCERRMQGNSVCYECKDSGGQRLRRCYDAALNRQSRSTAKPRNPPLAGESSQQSEQQEQRIYKRTISYSYAQAGSQDNEPTTGQPTPAPPVDAVTPRSRRLARVLRRRVALPIPVGVPVAA